MLYYIRLNLTKFLLVLIAALLIVALGSGIFLYFHNKQSIAPYDTDPFPQPEITEPVAPTEYPEPTLDPELANQPVAPLTDLNPTPQPENTDESDPDFFEATTAITQAKDYLLQGMVAGTLEPPTQEKLASLPPSIDKVQSYAIPTTYNIQATWNTEEYNVCVQIELNAETWFQKNSDPVGKGSCE